MKIFNPLKPTKYVRSILFSLALTASFTMASQEIIRQQQPPQKPVLIDDTHNAAMLEHKRQNDYATVLTECNEYPAASLKKIKKIEKCRNKRLKKIDTQIEKANINLKKSKSKISDRSLKRKVDAIANLHIKRQKVIEKAKVKIEKLKD